MKASLFTYGTLMSPELWQEITGHLHPCRPYSISGFQRRMLKERPYPGLIRKENYRTKGILYSQIEQKDLEALDKYEGPEYRRINIIVNPSFPIFTYLYIGNQELISDKDWIPNFQ